MIVYNHRKFEVLDVIDFQSTVPNSMDFNNFDSSAEGLSVGVPGMLMGLWEAHGKFGRLTWQEVVMPAINLAKYSYTFFFFFPSFNISFKCT